MRATRARLTARAVSWGLRLYCFGSYTWGISGASTSQVTLWDSPHLASKLLLTSSALAKQAPFSPSSWLDADRLLDNQSQRLTGSSKSRNILVLRCLYEADAAAPQHLHLPTGNNWHHRGRSCSGAPCYRAQVELGFWGDRSRSFHGDVHTSQSPLLKTSHSSCSEGTWDARQVTTIKASVGLNALEYIMQSFFNA